MSFTGALMKSVVKRSARRFEKATLDPVGTQTNKLLSMVRKNANTVYGKRHGFASIKSIADFQKQVPVVTYEDIRADMDRVVAGESGIFTTEDPVMFAQTSGTTGNPKFIPVTSTCRGHDHSDVMRTWLWHSAVQHPTLFDKIVSLVSPAVEGVFRSGLPYGSTSGDIYRNQPWIVRRIYPIPYRVFEIQDYQAKYYALMRMALQHRTTFLTTANPSSILKMCQKGDDFGEQIIRDIHDGKLSADFDIELDIRDELEAGLHPLPEQAVFLEQARSKRDGRLLPGDYWPTLAMIGCWKGGTVGHYLSQFGGWFDPDGVSRVSVRDMGYLSSEFRGSIPLSEDGSRGVLTVAANFYEFVDPEDLESSPDDPKLWRFLTCDQLEDGREYYIFVTTSGGLYRYDINDVIQVQGTYNKTPQIVFLRKGRGMTNITGEKISVNQIIEAVQRSAEQTHAVPAHFKAEADTGESRYRFLIEFANPPATETPRTFLQALDSHLKELNIEYKSKRDSQRLAPPQLRVMREGWYERDRQKRTSAGRDFQAKTVLLSTRALAEEPVETDQAEIQSIVDFPDGG